MSRLATKIKSLFSFNSDSYHVHKATEEELLTRPPPPLPQPPLTVLRRAPKPPPESGRAGGVNPIDNSKTTSIAAKSHDKKQSRQRKVSVFVAQRAAPPGVILVSQGHR